MKLRDLFTKKQPAPIERPVQPETYITLTKQEVLCHWLETLDSGVKTGVYTQAEQDAITYGFLKKPLQHLEARQ